MMRSEDALHRECRVFCQYLLGLVPLPYVVWKYSEAHQMLPALRERSRFDGLLVRSARIHRSVARLADSYARIFLPAGLLRKKLILLLAILETCPPSCHLIEAVDSGGNIAVVLRLAARGIGSAITLAAGTLLFFPAQLLFGRRA